LHDKDTSPKSRDEQYPQDDPLLRMPECDGLVLSAFIDCGIYQPTGMGGSIALSWQEIKAYSEVTNVNLTSWEASMVHLMSSEYITFKNFATENRTARSNYQPELTEEDTLKRAERMSLVI